MSTAHRGPAILPLASLADLGAIVTPGRAKVPQTGWNEGYGAGVLLVGHSYEAAVARWGSTKWEFGLRDVTSGSGWVYWYIPKTWATTGGNLSWWGAENENHQSSLGTGVSDGSISMHYMDYEDNNGSWHYPTFTDGNCPGHIASPHSWPWYFGCSIYSSGKYLEAWTDAH
jgi:hypothetical protein